MVYDKPVAVFTNAACYSACDMFDANMQDNDAAVIIGEDPQTGGGGANPVDYHSFLYYFNKIDFPPLQLTELEFGSQKMMVSWRQFVRQGKKKRVLIENAGVKVNHMFRPTVTDIMNPSSNSQLDMVITVLREKISQCSSWGTNNHNSQSQFCRHL